MAHAEILFIAVAAAKPSTQQLHFDRETGGHEGPVGCYDRQAFLKCEREAKPITEREASMPGRLLEVARQTGQLDIGVHNSQPTLGQNGNKHVRIKIVAPEHLYCLGKVNHRHNPAGEVSRKHLTAGLAPEKGDGRRGIDYEPLGFHGHFVLKKFSISASETARRRIRSSQAFLSSTEINPSS